MTPEETLDWLADQHFDQCREERPIQDWIRKMKVRLPEQEQGEPVCWITPDGEGWRMRLDPPVNDVPLGWTALFDKPQQRKPLTDEQLKNHYQNNEWLDGVRFAEQFHGIKE